MPFRKPAAIAIGAVLLLCGLAETLFARTPRWRRVDVGQFTIPMEAIYAVDSNHIWASTAFQEVLYTKDGGVSWSSFSLAECCAPMEGGVVKSFFFFDTLTGWIAGAANNFPPAAASFRLHTTDGGLSWETQLDTGYKSGGRLLFLDRRKGFDIIADGCSFKDSFLVTEDSGKTWQIWTTGIPSCDVHRFHFVDSLNGWGISSRPAPHNTAVDLIRTRDGGKTWSIIPASVPVCAGVKIGFLDTLNAWMWHCDPNTSFQYRFSRSPDGGITWDSLYTFQSDGTFWFYAFEAVDTAHFWLAGYKDGFASVQFSSDAGRTWVEQMPGVGDPLWGFYALDANHAYAVGANGFVYIYSPPLIGDLDLNWKLTTIDVVLLLNHAFLALPTAVPPADMDFNEDCKVDATDIVMLLSFIFLQNLTLKWGCS